MFCFLENRLCKVKGKQQSVYLYFFWVFSYFVYWLLYVFNILWIQIWENIICICWITKCNIYLKHIKKFFQVWKYYLYLFCPAHMLSVCLLLSSADASIIFSSCFSIFVLLFLIVFWLKVKLSALEIFLFLISLSLNWIVICCDLILWESLDLICSSSSPHFW